MSIKINIFTSPVTILLLGWFYQPFPSHSLIFLFENRLNILRLKLYAEINKFFVVVKPRFIRPRNAFEGQWINESHQTIFPPENYVLLSFKLLRKKFCKIEYNFEYNWIQNWIRIQFCRFFYFSFCENIKYGHTFNSGMQFLNEAYI